MNWWWLSPRRHNAEVAWMIREQKPTITNPTMTAANNTVPLPMLAQVAAGHVPPLEPLTIEQVEQMMRHGILEEGAPLELIDGLLVRKDRSARGEDVMTHNPAHALCVSRLLSILSIVQSFGCHLRCQQPVALSRTRAPEPDLAVIRGTPVDYRGRHPGPKDIVAVMEVADSSLYFDQTTKQKLYAHAEIPTYWIANLVDNVVEVYEQPNASLGKYGEHNVHKLGAPIELSLGPGQAISIRVDDVIG